MRRSKVVLLALVITAMVSWTLYFFSCSEVTAAGKPGVINGSSSFFPLSADEALRAMTSYYNHRMLNMSAEAGNIKVTTKYGANRWLVGFYNNSSTTVTIRFKCVDDTATLVYKVSPLSPSQKFAPIDTVFKTGTSDSLFLNFQRI